MKLSVFKSPLVREIDLPISKSIANRNLIIAGLCKQRMALPASVPNDVKVLNDSLESISPEKNMGMAGTAMRFLAAFYAVQVGKEVLLTGDSRMKLRPIGLLVNALRELGVPVSYAGEDGFPPVIIKGATVEGGELKIPGDVSSQFVSALMLIAPTFTSGLRIKLSGTVLSRPYIELTANCMKKAGAVVRFENDEVIVDNGSYSIPIERIETDWSSASYFYALASAIPHSRLLLKGLKLDSPQGDSIVAEWFKPLGVTSVQLENGVEISSCGFTTFPKEINFRNHPDLAQTFAFLAAALGKSIRLQGLDNLRIKETDRVVALKTELEKLGISVLVSGNEMAISGLVKVKSAYIETYNDHRMAMSAAVLAAIIPIELENPEVVAKSFPEFWSSFN